MSYFRHKFSPQGIGIKSTFLFIAIKQFSRRGNQMKELLKRGEYGELIEAMRYSPRKIAQKLCLSLRQLERIIKKHFGVTVSSWVRSHRMEKALAYLTAGEKVAYVAFQLCYKQASHFCHEFKKFYGFSPITYCGLKRAQFQNGSDL